MIHSEKYNKNTATNAAFFSSHLRYPSDEKKSSIAIEKISNVKTMTFSYNFRNYIYVTNDAFIHNVFNMESTIICNRSRNSDRF